MMGVARHRALLTATCGCALGHLALVCHASLPAYSSYTVLQPPRFPVPASPSSSSSLPFSTTTLCRQHQSGGNTICAPPRGLAVGDVTGDGIQDVVTSHIFAPIGLWVGSQGGSFVNAESLANAAQNAVLLQPRDHPGAFLSPAPPKRVGHN